jgi:hypothetical protein
MTVAEILTYLRSFNHDPEGMAEVEDINGAVETGDFVRTSDYLLIRRQAENEVSRLQRENNELRASLRRICGWVAAFGVGLEKLGEQEAATLQKHGLTLKGPSSWLEHPPVIYGETGRFDAAATAGAVQRSER